MNLDANQNSININPGFVIGSELGIAVRLEYEKSNRGKIMLNGLGGIYLKDGDFIMGDLGLGYGYPVVMSKSSTFFINGFVTAMIQSMPLGAPPPFRFGPSCMIEFEYRKTWTNFSINVVPSNRLFYSGGNYSDYNFIYSWGIRVGLMYSFRLKKQ
jgi:hypothetical protein